MSQVMEVFANRLEAADPMSSPVCAAVLQALIVRSSSRAHAYSTRSSAPDGGAGLVPVTAL